MTYANVDDKARICLTKEMVDRYGKRFVVVPAKDEIILIPVPDDPIKALQEEGRKIPKGLTIADLKKLVRERAKRDALEGLGRAR